MSTPTPKRDKAPSKVSALTSAQLKKLLIVRKGDAESGLSREDMIEELLKDGGSPIVAPDELEHLSPTKKGGVSPAPVQAEEPTVPVVPMQMETGGRVETVKSSTATPSPFSWLCCQAR